MYVNRDIERNIKKALQAFSVVALIGPRQTGKSTMLKSLLGKEYSYISFDDPMVRERANDDPVLFLSTLGEKAIIDEIQYVPQILPYIKIKVDENRPLKGRFVITGSQQFNLMKNVNETLAGRIALFTLLPFNSNEINKIEFLKDKLKKSEDFFVYSSLNGLYPEPVVNGKMDVKLWYASYIQTYLERDIPTLYNLGNLRDFTRFIKLLASRCSQILNLSTYARDIGVSVATIKNWLSILEAGNVIFILEPYYKNLGKRMIKSPKVYWNDTGLVCYLTGIYNKEHLLNGPMSGALFENHILQETIKSFYNEGLKPNIYYFRTSNGFEIDLIIEQNNELYPIELKFTKSPKISMTKPLNSFQALFPELNIQKGTIVSLSEESYALTAAVEVKNYNDYINSLKSFC
jgi:predicted AAA+ superfamily ATPase